MKKLVSQNLLFQIQLVPLRHGVDAWERDFAGPPGPVERRAVRRVLPSLGGPPV